MNILLLEDGKNEIDHFKTSCEYFEMPNNEQIFLDCVETIDEFKNTLIFSGKKYDAIIIDLSLSSTTLEYEGNIALKIALDNTKSILFVYSATVQHTENELLKDFKESALIKIIDRGIVSPDELVGDIFNIYNTGITRYLKSDNSLNKLINELFWNDTKDLIEYLKVNPTENNDEIIQQYLGIALESKIIEDLSKNETKIPGILLYISPKVKTTLSTGSIIKYGDKEYFVITPACDLAQNKTNFLHLLELIDENECLLRIDKKNKTIYEKKAEENIKQNKPPTDKNRRKAIFDNGQITKDGRETLNNLNSNPKGLTPYFALPKGPFFDKNRIIDLHHILTVSIENLLDDTEIICHIHNRITKDIISQFSSQFNRQGSPNYIYTSDI